MKSEVIAVSGREDRTDRVLEQASRMASIQKLSRKGALHLRLLSEEMMCLLRAVAGDVDGEFWIENNGPSYELHLRCSTVMDERRRRMLLSASSSGRNEAARGFLGKLRAFFEPTADLPLLCSFDTSGIYGDISWSMRSYQQTLRRDLDRNREGAGEAWDELEKSVLSRLADDVKVGIRGSEVEMTVFRNLE